MNKIIISLIAAIVIIVIAYFALNIYLNNENQSEEADLSITSYEDCVAAGYLSPESNPEGCETPDGRVFTRGATTNESNLASNSINIEGEIVCLPHLDTSGPTTTECSFGLLDDEGNYYVLQDPEPNQALLNNVDTSDRARIIGIFTAEDHDIYKSIGAIRINAIAKL